MAVDPEATLRHLTFLRSLPRRPPAEKAGGTEQDRTHIERVRDVQRATRETLLAGRRLP